MAPMGMSMECLWQRAESASSQLDHVLRHVSGQLYRLFFTVALHIATDAYETSNSFTLAILFLVDVPHCPLPSFSLPSHCFLPALLPSRSLPLSLS